MVVEDGGTFGNVPRQGVGCWPHYLACEVIVRCGVSGGEIGSVLTGGGLRDEQAGCEVSIGEGMFLIAMCELDGRQGSLLEVQEEVVG